MALLPEMETENFGREAKWVGYGAHKREPCAPV
jgi:hypothetical protein